MRPWRAPAMAWRASLRRRALLSPEDLRAYALSFAEGLRSAPIGAPVHAREGAKPNPASGTITEAELDAARRGPRPV